MVRSCSYHFGRFRGEVSIFRRDETEKLWRCDMCDGEDVLETRVVSEAVMALVRKACRVVAVNIGRDTCIV